MTMPTTDKPTPCAENTVTFDLAAEGNPDATHDAKALCATCPLIEQCRADLEKMVRAGWEPWGVRAGLDVTEQAALAGAGWLCKQCESNPVEVRGLPCDSCVTAAVQVRREAMAS